MKTIVSTLAVISALAMLGHQRLFAQDCNHNNIPDPCDLDCGDPGGPCDVPGCGESTDCNGNNLPDECDVIAQGGGSLFTTGFVAPEDIVQAAGEYPSGFLVTDINTAVLRHVSPLGGIVSSFAEVDEYRLGAVMAPDEFGGQGPRLFVAGRQLSSPGPDVVIVHPDGSVEPFADLQLSASSAGIAYMPRPYDGPAVGQLIATGFSEVGHGRVYLIDEQGETTVIAYRPDVLFWTPTPAPEDFGEFGRRVFMSDAVNSNRVFALDVDTNELEVFAEIPRDTPFTAGRQMAFSPIGWAAPIDPDLADERVLLLSVASSRSRGAGDDQGQVMVWDQRARRVAVMTTRIDRATFEPRGLTFVGHDLLIADVAEKHGWLWRATIHDFAVGDCNENDVPDDCDIAEGFSLDENNNGIPDECEGILCKHVKKFKTKCRRGKLKALVQLIDDRYAGEDVTFAIDEREYPVDINGQKAKLKLRDQQGQKTVTLTSPARCADPRVVDCG